MEQVVLFKQERPAFYRQHTKQFLVEVLQCTLTIPGQVATN